MNDGNLREPSYPLSKILPWAGALVIAVAGGTFAVIKYATEHRIAALERDVSVRDRAIQQMRSLVSEFDVSLFVPGSTLNASSDKEKVRSLIGKIKGLESEKSGLVDELVKYARDALDPKSELFPLVKQLESGSQDERRKALQGLFSLEDPRSIPYLVDYYNQHSEEATQYTSIWEWFNLLLTLDRQAGLTFMANVLAAGGESKGDMAFKFLRDVVAEGNEETIVSKRLKEISLSSKDPLTRTRAKLLLHYCGFRSIVNARITSS